MGYEIDERVMRINWVQVDLWSGDNYGKDCEFAQELKRKSCGGHGLIT